ncbi:hypothetical protein U752_01745 [Streptococcus pseudopneumoniae 1321]|nr:hypothetical protein U752_01745 [Streptococcus pseudopneumoniae 1321]
MLVDFIMFLVLFLIFLLMIGFIVWCDKHLKGD